MEAQHPDQHYIAALLANDAKTISVIYKNFAGKVVSMVRAMGGTTDDGWDIFQDGLLAITMSARKEHFALNCPFEAFLMIVCKRKWLNYLSLKGRKMETVDGNPGSSVIAGMEDQEKSANQLVHDYEMHQLIKTYVRKLSPACRTLLEMVLADYKLSEISETLDKTYNSTKKSKWECEQKLINLIRQAPEYLELANSKTLNF